VRELWTYYCDDVRYQRKDKPEAWSKVGEVEGKMFMSYPFFEFIPGTQGKKEPVRYGDFVIDITLKFYLKIQILYRCFEEMRNQFRRDRNQEVFQVSLFLCQ